MEKSLARTSRWLALATLVYPVSICWSEEPLESTEDASIVTTSVEHPESPTIAPEPTHTTVARPLFQHTSYPAAWTAAQVSNRPILVYVSMPQCPHCTKMLDETFVSPGMSELVSDSFETLQVGRYTHATLISKLHVKWYPTTVLVGSNNRVLAVIEGYVDANTLRHRLELGIAAAHGVTQTR